MCIRDRLDGEEAHIVDAVAFMRGNRAYFEDFITRSTYHSNAIEGSTLSYAETYAILWNDNSLQVTATARELYEAINHKYALSLALEEMQVPLSERLVKRIAQAINKNINEIGGYRTISVLIRGAEHLPPKPNQVNQLMMQLVHEYNHADDVDPYPVSYTHLERDAEKLARNYERGRMQALSEFDKWERFLSGQGV